MLSAGDCMACGKHAEKRYGGNGQYLAVCLDCWTDAAEDLRGLTCDQCGARLDGRPHCAFLNAELELG